MADIGKANAPKRPSNEEANRITRERLCTAAIQLAGEGGFDKASITEIARRAGVSRVAFYRNYASKEALVEDACSEIRAQIMESLGSERFRTDHRAWRESVFATIRDNAAYFRIYLEADIPLVEPGVLDDAYPAGSAEGRYRSMAREGAFLAVLADWFRRGMRETPAQMADICGRLLG